MKKYGIDISKHNGDVDYTKIKESGVEFVMIRAGYGKGNIDDKFVRNIEGCIAAGLPVGAYWFSYALNATMAKAEADYFNKALEPYKGKVGYPVAYDFEYDSENYMEKNNVTPSKRLNTDIVIAFLSRLEELGWFVANYTNVDYMNNHFYQSELDKYTLWLARWGVSEPGYDCAIWQYSSTGAVEGVSTNTDLNYCYKDYETLIQKNGFNGYVKSNNGNASTSDGNGSEEKITYYPKTSYTGVSLVDCLKEMGVDSSYSYRKKIAEANGISDYTGTAIQNTKLLELAKNGTLIKV